MARLAASLNELNRLVVPGADGVDGGATLASEGAVRVPHDNRSGRNVLTTNSSARQTVTACAKNNQNFLSMSGGMND